MSDIVIEVENLSKKYRLGANGGTYKTLRESLVGAGTTPLRRMVRLAGRHPAEGEEGHRPDFWALKDVSFQVKRGEVLGIIGRNGAGKSTLLKILSQITEPTSGEVRVKGRVASLLEVGTGFHPELTGRENIYLNAAILGMSRREIDRKFDEIVAFAEVEQFIDTAVKHFSSGMYLRLAFSVAAHLEPEVLLVDEVLAVGDAEFQRKCLGKMSEVAGQGRTVLFVSHNMTALSALCGSALLLSGGGVTAAGKTARVVEEYISEGGTVTRVDLTGHQNNVSDVIRFLGASVSQGGVETGTVTTDLDIEVRLGYSILKACSGVEVSLAVRLANGEYLFSTTDTDHFLDADRPRDPGRYEAVCRLPPHLFRAGRYYLDCGSSRPNVEQLVHLRQILAIDVLDPGGIEVLTGQARLGVIAPRLRWQTHRITQVAPTPACAGSAR